MSSAGNVNDLLQGHVALDIECLDRLYLNAYVPRLQVGGQVVSFMKDHLSLPVPSPAVFQRMGNAFRRQVYSFAEANDIPVVHFKKGDRRIDLMRPYLDAATEPGVVAIGVAQEFQWVFTGYERPTDNPGAVNYGFEKAERRVSCFYLSVGGPPVKGRSPGCLLGSVAAPNRSGCQVGAPAAKRGRTSLTPARTGALWRRSKGSPSAS
jgi:hypothetical protein